MSVGPKKVLRPWAFEEPLYCTVGVLATTQTPRLSDPVSFFPLQSFEEFQRQRMNAFADVVTPPALGKAQSYLHA